jgi:hypothetical protein
MYSVFSRRPTLNLTLKYYMAIVDDGQKVVKYFDLPEL